MSSTVSTIALFATYTALSVAALLLVRYWMPAAQLAWGRGEFLSIASVCVGLGGLCYFASFASWMLILGRVELTVAYPVAIGLTMAFSSIGAVVLLHEAFGVMRLLGTVLVFVGVWLIAVSE